jgi:hypothetical protein
VYAFSSPFKTLLLCALLFGASLPLTASIVEIDEQAATISHINVTGNLDELGVEITANAPVTPLIQTATGPDRLIVDIPQALPSSALHKILVNRGKVRDIRVGLLSVNPPISRVVLDLVARASQYTVSPLRNTIVIKLRDEFTKSRTESKPALKPIAVTIQPTSVTPVANTSVTQSPLPDQPSAPSRARWIVPILLMTTILAMLVMALIGYIQSKRFPRGI